MISESVVLRCIASCLETSEYYVGRGNRPLADWWHDRADIYADRLEISRQATATPRSGTENRPIGPQPICGSQSDKQTKSAPVNARAANSARR
jgi:hypothetical protein